MRKTDKNGMVYWGRRQILLDARMLKYGAVGSAGIIVNLAAMALLLTAGLRRGWTPSAMASLVSTSGNFILHNCWTFSDRRHQGLRLVRGFLSFVLISTIGVSITTAFYAGFTRIAVHFTNANSQLGTLKIPLTCQFAAILFGACTSYLLNRKFTWPQAQSNASADLPQVQEV